MRSIKPAQISLILTTFLLCSCAVTWPFSKEEPIEIVTKAVERQPLKLPDPNPISTTMPKWIIVTPENQEKVFEELESNKYDQVIFGLTDEGYEDLSMTVLKLRNYIVAQKKVLNKYREYYGENKDSSTDNSTTDSQ